MSDTSPTRILLAEMLHREAALRKLEFPHLDCELVLRYGSFVGSAISRFRQLPRAMEEARRRIGETEASGGSVANGMVILAETMERSKGRFTRSWHAPAGGIWGCLVHANTLLDQSKRFVPLAAGVACCEAVRMVGGDRASLRWVNDVLLGEKKVAGFLVEGCTGPRYGDEYHLVGFGINVNNRTFPHELRTMATSLADELGHDLDLEHFAALFLAKLAWNFGLLYYEEARMLAEDGFSGPGGSHQLLHNWRTLSDSPGQRVVFGFDVMTAPQYEATVIGIDEDGGLIMRFDDGSSTVEYSGEIRYR